jgi:NAD(P)-dependent dehydrogenase (short-subunit alcohol dehydrogenase family)
MLLQGRSGIVTGAASGMGRAAAALFAAEGARVLCADLDGEEARKTAASIDPSGERAAAARLDVADKRDCQAVAQTALDCFGRIDFLANFAGVWDGRNTAEIEEEHWDHVLDVNLKGSFLIAQAVAPAMIAQAYGRIVLVGSVSARLGGNMGGPHYAASKGGVGALARALARRMGAHGVTVNSVNPGPVESAMTAGWTAEAKAKLVEAIPLGRVGQPLDIARPVLFLISDMASWITGETIEVNGGLYFG